MRGGGVEGEINVSVLDDAVAVGDASSFGETLRCRRGGHTFYAIAARLVSSDVRHCRSYSKSLLNPLLPPRGIALGVTIISIVPLTLITDARLCTHTVLYEVLRIILDGIASH